MVYKCHVCSKSTATAEDLAKHMVDTTLLSEEHIQWIESHGVSYPETVGLIDKKLGKGSYKALIEVVEKECKIEDCSVAYAKLG